MRHISRYALTHLIRPVFVQIFLVTCVVGDRWRRFGLHFRAKYSG